MRYRNFALAGVVALLLSQAASAQQAGNFTTGLTNISPSSINYTPINVSSAASPTPALSSLRPTSTISTIFRQLNPFSPSIPSAYSLIPAPAYRNAFTPVQPTTMTLSQ